jgi:AcrR family transcriptional regulator
MVSFEKPGRPPNDPAEERLRIYVAALPAIRKDGARASMDALARLAHMSVGGVYHYFDTKRQLLLHGLSPEALELACRTFHDTMVGAADDGPAEVTSAYVDKTVHMFRLIQPAATAALEMSIAEMRAQLATALHQDADGLIQVLAKVSPDLTEQSRVELASGIRRTLMALALDPQATEADVRRQLTAVLRGFVEDRKITNHNPRSAEGPRS